MLLRHFHPRYVGLRICAVAVRKGYAGVFPRGAHHGNPTRSAGGSLLGLSACTRTGLAMGRKHRVISNTRLGGLATRPLDVGRHRAVRRSRGQHVLSPRLRGPGRGGRPAAGGWGCRGPGPGRDSLAVENPLRQVTGAIHIYGGDFFGTPRSDWETGEERPYNLERARQAFAEANERWCAECARSGETTSAMPSS
jgi:hypothetical protein